MTRKLDIFSLGILFHQYFCGETPEFDRDNYDYLFEAVLDDAEIILNGRIPPDFQMILRKMLSKNPEERPEANEILQMMQYGVNGIGRVEVPRRPVYAPSVSAGSSVRAVTMPGSALKSTMRRSASVSAPEPAYEPEPIFAPITEPAPMPKKEAGSFFKKADDLL